MAEPFSRESFRNAFFHKAPNESVQEVLTPFEDLFEKLDGLLPEQESNPLEIRAFEKLIEARDLLMMLRLERILVKQFEGSHDHSESA